MKSQRKNKKKGGCIQGERICGNSKRLRGIAKQETARESFDKQSPLDGVGGQVRGGDEQDSGIGSVKQKKKKKSGRKIKGGKQAV